MMRMRLSWEIGGLLAVKAVLLATLYFAFFAHPAPASSTTTAIHLMGGR